MASLAKLSSELQTLRRIVFGRIRGETHAERLESFYSRQAEGYDAYRRRLLHGRSDLVASLPLDPGAVWVDLGAGTGENAMLAGERLSPLERVYQVDLCRSLLDVARERAEREGWTNVEPRLADVLQFEPGSGPADVVTFSYSLTMIPDWYAAIDAALRMLRPGGVLGVVDFYVSRKHPEGGLARHGWASRTLWPTFFGFDDVVLSRDHLPYLRSRLETLVLEERRGKVPYIPFARVPYYVFVGRKPRD